MTRVAHQVSDYGVLIVLRSPAAAPQSMRVTADEAKRFARAVLADLDPHAAAILAGDDFTYGPLSFERHNGLLRVDNRPVHLTRLEYRITELLAMRQGAVMTKEAILDHIYQGRDEPELKIVDVLVCKIRKKLAEAGAPGLLDTVWGRGYRMLRSPGTAA